MTAMWSLFFFLLLSSKIFTVFSAKNNISGWKLELKILLNKYMNLCFTNQGSTAQKNHEYDKGFKPGVFNNLVAGFSQIPPFFSSKLYGTTHITTKVSNTTWKWETAMNAWKERTCMQRVAQETSGGRGNSTVTLTTSLLGFCHVLPWGEKKKKEEISHFVCLLTAIYTHIK